MKTLAALLCLGGSLFAAPKDPPVTLHVDTNEQRQLLPSSAFELRFNERMVSDDNVGKPGTDAPLQLKPAVPGKWVWVSSQSGVFQLSEPPPLGTEIHLTLRSNLQNAEGKAFRGSLKESFATPPFRLKGSSALGYWDAADATAKPRMMLCFAAEVDAAAAARQLTFVNDSKVKSRLSTEYVDITKQATHEPFPSYRSDDKSNLSWMEDFREFRLAGKKAEPASEGDEDGESVAQKGGPVFKNQLVVTPATPLPPGANWKLIVARGLASTAGEKLPADVPVDIGTVTPFAVSRVASENLVYSGKRVLLEFQQTPA